MKENNQEIPQNWNFYLGLVENQLASFRINLALIDIAPVENYPFRINFSMKMLDAGQEGVGTEEEFERICQIEDAICEQIDNSFPNIFAGTLRNAGLFDIWIYAQNPDGYEEAIDKVMNSFPDYQYHVNIAEDPKWNDYLQFLYPPPYEYQTILNRNVYFQLKEQGNKDEIEREIDHWLYFSSEENRDKCVVEVQKLGYKVVSAHKVEDESPVCFVLHISRMDTTIPNNINDNVWELVELAESFEGYYDGWGCNIVK